MFINNHRFQNPIQQTERKSRLQKVVKTCSKALKLPFMGKYPEESETDLVLIPCIQEQQSEKNSDEINKIYDFNTHIWTCKRELEEKIKDCQIQTYFEYLQEQQGINDETVACADDTVDDNADRYDLALAEGGNFTTVTSKKTKSSRMYSEYCSYSFTCQKGLKCHYSHRETEKQFFKEHGSVERKLYKSKQCTYLEKCKYNKKTYMCPFAHGSLEARCLRCNKIGVHWTDECPILN